MPYIVAATRGSMITARRDDHEITRNSSWFKVIEENGLPRGDDGDDDLISINEDNEPLVPELEPPENEVDDVVELRRSTRVTGEPVRYPMDVPQ